MVWDNVPSGQGVPGGQWSPSSAACSATTAAPGGGQGGAAGAPATSTRRLRARLGDRPDLLWSQLRSHRRGCRQPPAPAPLPHLLGPEVAEPFKSCRRHGHAPRFRSGLLEHTCRWSGRLARWRVTTVETRVWWSRLPAPDLGKVWELESGASIEYTDEGRLIGHLTLEVLYVTQDRRAAELPGGDPAPAAAPPPRHHGEYEYGSPPAEDAEAQLVHVVDNLDARLSSMLEAISSGSDDESAWSPYSRILDRMVYRRRYPKVSGSAARAAPAGAKARAPAITSAWSGSGRVVLREHRVPSTTTLNTPSRPLTRRVVVAKVASSSAARPAAGAGSFTRRSIRWRCPWAPPVREQSGGRA